MQSSCRSLKQRADTLRRVGSYAFEREIGAGGTSFVYLGRHVETGEKVALKVVDSLTISTASLAAREITLLKALSHPNLVRIHDMIHVEDERLLVLVIDYLPGGDLFDWISSRENPSDDQETARLFRSIASAVRYCHTNMVVHRDIKLENVLLDGRGGVYLVDFGLGNFMSAGQMLNTFCGSPIYTAPEVLQRRPYVGPEVDVWSLGVTLYAMVTGLFPWEGSTLQEQLRNSLHAKIAPAPGVSAECLDLISRMLQINPLQRATMTEILSHPWLNHDSPTLSRLPPASPGTQLNQRVLKYMVNLGFSEAQIKQAVKEEDFKAPEYELYHIYLRNGFGSAVSSSPHFPDSVQKSQSSSSLSASPSSSSRPSSAMNAHAPKRFLQNFRLFSRARSITASAGV